MSNLKKIFDLAAKGLKDRVMGDDEQTPRPDNSHKSDTEKSLEADMIIRSHIVWSMGAGLIPVLIADIFAVSALQLDMIRQLCRVYDVDFSETESKAIITALTSSTLARVSGSLVKLIPGVGTILGGVTVSVFAGASTYALGEVFKKHFESGGTILDIDPKRLKKLYKEKFEKGKKVAEQLRKEKQQENQSKAEMDAVVENEASAAEENQAGKDIVERLRELAALKENGIITAEEFETMKKKLIEKF